MRSVIFAINMTLDGCVDHTKQIGDDETHEYFTQLLRSVDLGVFGRKTYELMVPFWPDVARNQNMDKASNEFALAFDATNKVVFSRILESVEDKKTRIVSHRPRRRNPQIETRTRQRDSARWCRRSFTTHQAWPG